ncbi:MAG: ABC transporter ATP-binding protein/permease [Clostridiales bacterium]|jgi:ABC-type multidrug transport system fused ATPase/permease subunit|nr:ABC transporter ATP-binding protein/permease [Clostridiales bacterium]
MKTANTTISVKKRHTFFKLLGYLFTGGPRAGVLLGFALYAALATAAFGIVGPLLVGRTVDAAAGAGRVDYPALALNILLLGGCYALLFAHQWLLTALSNRISVFTVKRMRTAAFHKLTTLPLSFLDAHSAGDLVARFTADIDMVAEGVLQSVSQLVTGIATLVGCLVMMILTDPAIAGAMAGMTPLAVLLSAGIAKNAGKKYRETQKLAGAFSGDTEEVLRGQTVVKAFGYEAGSTVHARAVNKALFEAGHRAVFYSSVVNPATRLVSNVTYAMIGLIGGLAAINRGLSVGAIAALISYSLQFSRPFNEMTSILTQLQGALAAADRYFDLVALPSEPAERDKPDLVFTEGRIAFEDVSFSYTPGTPLIEHLTIAVPPHAKVGIVGKTGAGKSTLINLLMRFYEVDGGRILIDGTDIAACNRDSVRRCFAMVLQETWLYAASLAENIAFDARVDPSRLHRAAAAARANHFIERLPERYQTRATESGFSEGERQLVTIARAVYAAAPMLIFDEATSSIDTHTEREIQRALKGLLDGRTSFVIAHRLSTIADADVILVMKGGAVTETGTHDDLMSLRGEYYTLYMSQFDTHDDAPAL